MVDLYYNSNPCFTRWIVDNQLLEGAVVVIDAGCQGGMHPRWEFFGDYLDFYGFDPISEAIASLAQEKVTSGRRTYHPYALGDEDGERQFFVKPRAHGSSFFHLNPSSIIYRPKRPDPFDADVRNVAVRRLDTLLTDGVLPRADFIKLDCEGFEPEILRGARRYLSASRTICVVTETGFNVSPHYPRGHFHAVNEILVEYGLFVFDLNVVRSPRPVYAEARLQHPLPKRDPRRDVPHLVVGGPRILDVVFCRDFVAEHTKPEQYPLSTVPGQPSLDEIIKAAMNFELYGLMDCAYDLVVHFRDRLQSRFKVEEALELLLIPPPHARNTADVVQCLTMLAELRTKV